MNIHEAAPLSYIVPSIFKRKIVEWLEEDLPSFDMAAVIQSSYHSPVNVERARRDVSKAVLYMKFSWHYCRSCVFSLCF